MLSSVEKSALAYAAAEGRPDRRRGRQQLPGRQRRPVPGRRRRRGEGLAGARASASPRPIPSATTRPSRRPTTSCRSPRRGRAPASAATASSRPSRPTSPPSGTMPTAGAARGSSPSSAPAPGRYGYAEGTSFATPLVAGAAALARDVNPQLTAEQTADVIRRSATRTGSGRVEPVHRGRDPRRRRRRRPGPRVRHRRAGAGPERHAGHHGAVRGPGRPRRAGPLSAPSGITSFRSSAPPTGRPTPPPARSQASPVTYDETATPGETRWYRGTVCDARAQLRDRPLGPDRGEAPRAGPAGLHRRRPPGDAERRRGPRPGEENGEDGARHLPRLRPGDLHRHREPGPWRGASA